MKYILGIDQSTQGTKALLVDESGAIAAKRDLAHAQLINERGWISHNPEEIYENVLKAAREVIKSSGIDKRDVAAIGISNQRETTVMWDRTTGRPLAEAVVWQCARASKICEREEIRAQEARIREITGMKLSPYFPAAKMAWLMEQVPGAEEKSRRGELCLGTIDSWLVYKLTEGRSFLTDYSNASRTQLFDIHRLQWDEKLCSIFGIDVKNLPNVCNSDADFGQTSLGGYLEQPIPIHCVMGDSHGALFGQGCLEAGMVKATYGTGSSVMMNIGEKPVISSHGVVTSIAWGMKDGVNYVLEGNLNYTGAVITWLKDDMELIQTPEESELLAYKAAADDSLYLVPAFSGLGAPYWNSSAQAAAVGMTRTTRRAEFVRAGLECIAYQITDIVKAMEQDSGMKVRQLRVDGGPTANGYLMQFQSNILDAQIQVPDMKELSAVGVSYASGMAAGLYDAGILEKLRRKEYAPCMPDEERTKKYQGWINAVGKIL